MPDVFLEKFVQRARHIEVQLLGDRHGDLVHLFERDCSIQRRHQKVVELAPAPNLDPATCGERILDAALAVGRAVGLDNAGTVEFLVDADAGAVLLHRGQPAHPGRAHRHRAGHRLRHRQVADPRSPRGCRCPTRRSAWATRSQITTHGFAIQCRVTTEDPANDFVPDYGRLSAYRSAGGLGIRLDAGTAFGGAVITPFYDSLLVKVTASGLRFVDAARRMERCLQEFRVRGVKTNIPFLLNLVDAPGVPRRRRDDAVPRRDAGAVPASPTRRDRATQAADATSPR